MSRREFPAKVKAAAFERANGCCENSKCGVRLSVGKFHYDHVIPDALGGEPTLENCAVLCHPCHLVKTAGEDVPRIAKTKRIRNNHIGAKVPSRNPLPGSRASGWKRRMDGTVVRREK